MKCDVLSCVHTTYVTYYTSELLPKKKIDVYKVPQTTQYFNGDHALWKQNEIKS